MSQEIDPLISQRATNNPYITGASLILRRLAWDLNPQSWVSRSHMKRIRNSHKGEKAVILCNGPSLMKTDFSLLKGTYTFGLNKINLLYDKTDFRPSSIVAVNRFVLEQNKEFFSTTETPLFLNKLALKFLRPRKNITFLHSTAHRVFAKDCSMSIYESHTVTYVALQLAFHMGFEEVALIGADHNFATKGSSNKVVTAGETDASHFDPKYFSDGMKWELPDLFESEVGYTMAKNMFEAHGRRIVNATDGGKLEIYPRMTLSEFLEK
jgi:hypothetical protein